MNYIRIANHFINVAAAQHIRVLQSRESEIVVEVVYRDNTQTIRIPVELGITEQPQLTAKTVAASIQDAICNVCEGDCENVEDYIEDNLYDDEEDY